VLAGDVNPSGKMPFTWYASLDQCGAHATDSYPGTWREDYKIIDEEYKEGIYVGYRWTDKHKIRPLFAFGHGLSYTTFKIENVKVLTQSSIINVQCSIKNTGSRAGAETVQLYISDKKASVDRPVKELKAFQKVFLQPGESRDVTLSIGRDALSFYDEAKGEWIVEPGQFEALIGTASDRLAGKCTFEWK
jgi:beta-glucosidase